MVDPHLYINTDIGQIEIEPADGYREIWHKFPDEEPKGNVYNHNTFITIVKDLKSDTPEDLNIEYPKLNYWHDGHWAFDSNCNILYWMELPDWKDIE